MKLTGIVKTWNQQEWLGTIESEGKCYIVRRDGMRRGTKLALGQTVTFNVVNRLAGPTADDVQIVDQDSQK